MKPIQRDEILDYATYGDHRASIRRSAMDAKAARRIHVGPNLTFLFENRETVRYQIQEMMRVERIVREADIAHEMRTYNELLGSDGAVCATLLVEIDDEAERDQKLTAWVGLNETLYAVLPDGARVTPTWDARQVGDARLSSVQYLTFDLGGVAPVALGSSHPELTVEAPLTDAQRAALQADLDEA